MSARACCPRCSRARSTRPSAPSGTSRASSCAASLPEEHQRPAVILTVTPVNELGVPDYDELVLVANSDKLDDKRDDLRLFIGALAKGAQEARRDPRGSADALLDANRDLKAEDDARERSCDAAGALPRIRQAVGLPRPRPVAGLRSLDVRQRTAEGAPARRARRSRTSCCRAKGSSALAG